MAQLVKRAFQLTPNQLLYQQKRYRGKINLKKPKVNFVKKIVNELLTPYFINPDKDKPLYELCKNVKLLRKEELGPYEKILTRDVRNWFDNSKMIACLHVNSIKEDKVFDFKVDLKMVNMYYKRYGKSVVFAAIEDSPYEAITPLLKGGWTAFVFSPDINATALKNIVKKYQQLCIMGGVLERQVFKCDDFLKYGSLDMTTTQLGLVQTLQNAGGVNLSRQLTHHQTTLVARLKQIGTNETTSNDDEKQSVPV
ncbi:39S ribosomal protein L10, mitochondrial [Hylaeus anthracinus]|uniref:39S ribosomal protein L10, mitochondrial n=1 Tax=Hylaeus anthracinus TaxID=313031 RepID=UPI0023BA0B03|nr:39S ribosomal protein L10, mitochondrial [Hylaeus anthracinus]